MNGFTRTGCGALLLLAGLAAWMFVTSFGGRERNVGYPGGTGQDAIRFFQAHKAAFERLRQLAEDTPFIYFHAGRQEVLPPGAFVQNPDVQGELLRLMSDLRLQAMNGPSSDWGLRMIFRSEGLAIGGTTHSFYHSGSVPSLLVPDLDEYVPTASGSSSAFSAIEGPWYLRYDWDG